MQTSNIVRSGNGKGNSTVTRARNGCSTCCHARIKAIAWIIFTICIAKFNSITGCSKITNMDCNLTTDGARRGEYWRRNCWGLRNYVHRHQSVCRQRVPGRIRVISSNCCGSLRDTSHYRRKIIGCHKTIGPRRTSVFIFYGGYASIA